MLIDLRVGDLEEANTAVQNNITDLVAKDVEVEETILVLEDSLNTLEDFSNSKCCIILKKIYFSFTKIASFNCLAFSLNSQSLILVFFYNLQATIGFNARMNGEDAVCIDDILQFQNDVVNFGN